jgi:hypothetical protein
MDSEGPRSERSGSLPAADAARVLRYQRRFESFESGGVELAVEAGRNYGLLRTRGRTVRKTIDCLIATFCLVQDGPRPRRSWL